MPSRITTSSAREGLTVVCILTPGIDGRLRRAHGHLSEIGLPSGWVEMFVELTQALASRSA